MEVDIMFTINDLASVIKYREVPSGPLSSLLDYVGEFQLEVKPADSERKIRCTDIPVRARRLYSIEPTKPLPDSGPDGDDMMAYLVRHDLNDEEFFKRTTRYELQSVPGNWRYHYRGAQQGSDVLELDKVSKYFSQPNQAKLVEQLADLKVGRIAFRTEGLDPLETVKEHVEKYELLRGLNKILKTEPRVASKLPQLFCGYDFQR